MQINICPKCKQAILYNNEKMCADCAIKNYQRVTNFRRNHREHVNEMSRTSKKRIYHECVEKHLCVYCHKALPDSYDYRMCQVCRYKVNNRQRLNRIRKNG